MGGLPSRKLISFDPFFVNGIIVILVIFYFFFLDFFTFGGWEHTHCTANDSKDVDDPEILSRKWTSRSLNVDVTKKRTDKRIRESVSGKIVSLKNIKIVFGDFPGHRK